MAAGKENITGTLVPTGPSRENSKAQIKQCLGSWRRAFHSASKSPCVEYLKH
jgi:hypothetical protein